MSILQSGADDLNGVMTIRRTALLCHSVEHPPGISLLLLSISMSCRDNVQDATLTWTASWVGPLSPIEPASLTSVSRRYILLVLNPAPGYQKNYQFWSFNEICWWYDNIKVQGPMGLGSCPWLYCQAVNPLLWSELLVFGMAPLCRSGQLI